VREVIGKFWGEGEIHERKERNHKKGVWVLFFIFLFFIFYFLQYPSPSRDRDPMPYAYGLVD